MLAYNGWGYPMTPIRKNKMTDIVEWLRNSNSDEWCSGQLLKAADEIEKLREALKTVCLGVVAERESLDWFIMDGAALRVARKAIKDTTDD